MTIKLIFNPPEVITREQASQVYQNIPPEGVYPIIHYTQNNVRILITPPVTDVFLGKGTLWVTESKVFFYSSESNNGLAIDYPTIILHAITRQEAEGRCVYLQLEENFSNVQEGQGSLQDPEEEEEDKTTEIKLFPDDGGVLDAIYEALSECAALHPDKEFMEQENDSDNEYYGNGNDDNDVIDEQELSESGRATLSYLDSIIDNGSVTTEQQQELSSSNHNEEMFEDAEE
ncbi:hypothetical protein Glove_113g12 [Diversispora epigaea]|uniref:Methylosome subunit pICln n=1 Tax=Diversispora epigaea TaxID=1348612 RepID=A0A397J5Y1_9GLOM|nr:hypothetical protein Glove_113g12 [Diversispora epigaea]